MKIAMAGALTGPFQVLPGRDNLCGTHLANDPHSINYVLQGHVVGAGDDIGVGLNFAVHHYSKPGTFAVGGYPSGSATAPAIASVVREITVRDSKTWTSGSGSLVIDAGAKSGTLDLRLNSTGALAGLNVSGAWVCPEGSLT
jgi:hypothetical protein